MKATALRRQIACKDILSVLKDADDPLPEEQLFKHLQALFRDMGQVEFHRYLALLFDSRLIEKLPEQFRDAIAEEHEEGSPSWLITRLGIAELRR